MTKRNNDLKSISFYKPTIEERLKNRIRSRFKKKSTGSLIFKVSETDRIKVEYMYGGKYSVHRKTADKDPVCLLLVAGIDEVVKIIIKHKGVKT